MIAIQQILCPVDFSDCSKRALEYAVAVGRWFEAPVTALHAVADMPEIDTAPVWPGQAVGLRAVDRDAVSAALRQFVRAVGGQEAAAAVLAEGLDVREEILRAAAARRTDLIVIGSDGRTGVERFLLGSVAEKVLRGGGKDAPIAPRTMAGAS